MSNINSLDILLNIEKKMLCQRAHENILGTSLISAIQFCRALKRLSVIDKILNFIYQLNNQICISFFN